MELMNTQATAHDEQRQGEAYVSNTNAQQFDKFFYVESYGCAMNFADSEVVASILEKMDLVVLEI
jgi:tRNA-2-methylthio-N6-dimethylallyladenosine synthase